MIDLRFWFSALRSSMKQVVFVIAGIALATLAVILFYPRTYQSNAQLLVRVGREHVRPGPTADAAGNGVAMQLTRENEIETAIGVMRSRSVLEEVVDDVGVDVIQDGYLPGDESASGPGLIKRVLGSVVGILSSIDPVTDRERAIRNLGKELHIANYGKASVVSIYYTTKSPDAAQRIVQSWVDTYLRKHAEFHTTSGSYAFFQQEESTLKKQLEATYSQLREAKTKFGLLTVHGQQQLLEGRAASIRDALVEARSAKSASESRLAALGSLLENTEDRTLTEEVSGKANEAHDSMRAQLFGLEVLERELAAKYKFDHPRLLAVRNQLDEAQSIVKKQDVDRNEVSSDINPTHQRLEQEFVLESAALKSLATRLESLQEQREDLEEEIKELNLTESEIADLNRRVAVLEQRYSSHSRRLDQARLDDALQQKSITSVNVVQPATLEERPVTPNKLIALFLGFVASLATLVGLPIVLTMDSVPNLIRFRDRDEHAKKNDELLPPMFQEPEEELSKE